MNQDNKRMELLRLLESNLLIFKENFKLIVQECFEVVWQSQASHEALDAFVKAKRLEMNRGSFPQIPEVEEEDLLASGPPTSKKPKDPTLASFKDPKLKSGQLYKLRASKGGDVDSKSEAMEAQSKDGEFRCRSAKNCAERVFKPLNLLIDGLFKPLPRGQMGHSLQAYFDGNAVAPFRTFSSSDKKSVDSNSKSENINAKDKVSRTNQSNTNLTNLYKQGIKTGSFIAKNACFKKVSIAEKDRLSEPSNLENKLKAIQQKSSEQFPAIRARKASRKRAISISKHLKGDLTPGFSQARLGKRPMTNSYKPKIKKTLQQGFGIPLRVEEARQAHVELEQRESSDTIETIQDFNNQRERSNPELSHN